MRFDSHNLTPQALGLLQQNLVLVLVLVLVPLTACEKKIIVTLSTSFEEAEEASDPTFNYDDYFQREAAGQDMDLPPEEGEEKDKGEDKEEKEDKADASGSEAADGGEKEADKDKIRRIKAGSSITYAWRIEIPRPKKDVVTVICGLPPAGLMQLRRSGRGSSRAWG